MGSRGEVEEELLRLKSSLAQLEQEADDSRRRTRSRSETIGAAEIGARLKTKGTIAVLFGFVLLEKSRAIAGLPGGLIIYQGKPSISPKRTPMKWTGYLSTC